MPLLRGDRSAVQLKLLTLLAREVAVGVGTLPALTCAQLAHDAIAATSLDIFTYTPPVESALQVRSLSFSWFEL